jgi:predicted  nucleic acid-binding Zn-ribbon protein
LESLALSLRIERRWPVLVALGVAVLWFAAAAFSALLKTPPSPSAAEIAALVLALLPPIGLGLIPAALLPAAQRGIDLPELEPRLGEAGTRLADLHTQLAAIDGLLGTSTERTRALAETAAAIVPKLGQSAEALEISVAKVVEGGTATQMITEQFMAALPSLARTISEVDSTLRQVGQDSAVQLRTVETMLAAVQNSNREAATQADTSIAAMTGLLTRIDEASSRNTAALSKRAYALDAAIDGVLERTTAAVDGIHERVTSQLETLRTSVEGAGAQLAVFGDDGARLFNQRLDMLLKTSDQLKARFDGHAESSQQLQAMIDDVLAGLEARFAAIDERIAAADAQTRAAAEQRLAEFESRFARVRDAGLAAADDIGGRIAAIDESARASVASRVAELEERLELLRQSGEQASHDLAGRISAIDETLQKSAADRLAALEAQVAAVRDAGHAAANDIAARVADIEASVRAAATERLGGLEQGFADMRNTGTDTLREFEDRIAGIETALAGLMAPINASHAAVRALDDDTSRLGDTVANVDATLADKLAASQAALAALDGEAQRLFASVAALGSAVDDGATRLTQASAGLAGEREAVLNLAQQIEGHFASARSALADIESGAATAANAAAAGLGAEFARIAEASDAAANAMRGTLSAVVDDALAALDKAAAEGADAAFGGPVRTQMLALEDATARAAAAGQETAQRLATQMLSLVETVSVVESRIGEVEAKIHVRSRDSLAQRSMRLIDQLNTATVEVAQLLALNVPEHDWSAYLKGDRSVFARAIVPQLDRDMARRMSNLYQHDPEFRAEASRYVGLFEDLIQRMLGDRDGEALAATMLSSDVGKIYVAIAEATDRLPPSRSIN